MTSGMAANCSQPSAQVAKSLGLKRNRSTMGIAKPAASARARSLALSACNACVLSRSKAAKRLRAWFLDDVEARAMAADAVLAR